jgi:hypothetical protein
MTRLPLKQYAMAVGQLIALLAILGIISTEQAASITEVGAAAIAAVVALVPMLGTLGGILHSIWAHHARPEPAPQPPPPSPDVTLPPGEMFLRRRSDDHPRFGPD